MRYGYDLEYAGVRAESLGIYVVRRPDIPAPEYDMEAIVIPGRDGVLHKDNHRYHPIEITIEFNYLEKPEAWAEKWRHVKRWLSARNARLCLSDDADYFYHVYAVRLETNARTARELGTFSAVFTCDPYQYLKTGEMEQEQDLADADLLAADGSPILETGGEQILTTCRMAVLQNPFDGCCPLFRITGEGTCSFSVNGNWMEAAVDGEIFIDTEREAAYTPKGELAGRKVSGDYRAMRFLPGHNELTTSGDFTIYITPRWREV